jgi:DNA-binding SARP family transcriptional activator/DNA-binding XRE family transcriptional regulator
MDDDTDAATVGELLRRHRFRAGLTQGELAARAAVSVRAVRYIEQGRVARPQATSVRRLAAALGLAEGEYAVLLGAIAPDRPADAAVPRPVAGARQVVGAPRVDVLGPLVVSRLGAPVEIESRLLRTLLGLLAIHQGRVVPVAEIVDVLWEDRPPRTYRELVHTYIGQLRRVLEPDRPPRAPALYLSRSSAGYRLRLPTGCCDLDEFDELVAGARQAAPAAPVEAWRLYGRAWPMWRGPLLADGTARLAQHPVAVAVTGRRSTALLACADLAVELGRCADLLEPVRALAAAEPLHEGLAARLMLLYAGCGQQAAALELYEDLRGRLDAELGVAPGAELRAAHLRVVRGAEAAAPAPRATPGSSAVPAQLPADVVGFTGRPEHLRRLDQPQPGGVSAIAGMGGVGKTALALRWAHLARERYPDGQLYVDLAGHRAGQHVPPATALAGFLRALGATADQVPTDPAQATALYRSLLAGRRMLVLLDNAADAEQVRPLLPGDPGVRVLVTSRVRLTGLVVRDGADQIVLDAFSPAEAYALLARLLGARRVDAEPAAAAELAQLCAYLPLALRIAAANLAEAPLTTIADGVRDLRGTDRLAALAVAGDPDTAVRAAFDQSYAAAEPGERTLFRRLGLLPGPDTTAAAAAALLDEPVAPTARTLGRLAARHLVRQHRPGRFVMHDLLRLYAADLAAADANPAAGRAALARLGEHHLRHTAAAAGLLYPHLLHLPDTGVLAGEPPPGGPFDAPAAALEWLDAERANAVALVAELAARAPVTALLLADTLQGYFRLRGNTGDWAAVSRAGLAAARAAGDTRAEAAAELGLGCMHDTAGRFESARPHYRSAHDLAELAGWTDCMAVALNNLSRIEWVAGRPAQTVAYLTRALALHERAGRAAGAAVTLANLGAAHLELGRWAGRDGTEGAADTARARDYLLRALAVHREIGDRRNEADTLRVLAAAELDAGRPVAALGYAQDALALATAAADRRFEALALSMVATAHAGLRRAADAREHHDRALALARDAGDRATETIALLDRAQALGYLGEPGQLRELARAALAIARELSANSLERRALALLAGCRPPVRLGAGRGPGSAALR